MLRHNQIFSDGLFTQFSYPWYSAGLTMCPALTLICYHFIWKHRQCVEQRWKTILHHLTKWHAFIGNVANALRIIEKRYNAF